MREVLITIQRACSELAEMRLLLHSMEMGLPADREERHLSAQQAGHDTIAEQIHSYEESPSRVAPSSARSEHARTSPESVERAQQRAEKWKARCHDLQRDLADLSVEAAARDAALQVCLSL